MSEILKTLRGYNPPDRVLAEQKYIAEDIRDAANEIERFERDLAQAKEQLAAREARIAFIEQQLRAVGYVPGDGSGWSDMKFLREHEAKVYEHAAQICDAHITCYTDARCKDALAALSKAIRTAQERRNHGT